MPKDKHRNKWDFVPAGARECSGGQNQRNVSIKFLEDELYLANKMVGWNQALDTLGFVTFKNSKL